MIWINENFKILSDEEIMFLKNKCSTFSITEEPILYNDGLSKNYYYREKLNLDTSLEMIEIVNKIESYIKKVTNENGIELWKIVINKVFKDSNIDDAMHRDMCDLTFILYLNENFEGGEFEYINNENSNIKIKPKSNLCIISTDKLQHRVLPVKNGERFSLVMFFNIGKKNELTLI